jgi:hypothetical protein
MARSLIRKVQIHPDISDLIGQYGSGYFYPVSSGLAASSLSSSGYATYVSLNNSGFLTTSSNAVFTTGDQTIAGSKTFSTRPQINGTGVLLIGEAASLPTTLVYSTGVQTISGLKTFDVRPQVGGTNLALVTDIVGGSANLTGVVYTTGAQIISGLKTFDVRPQVGGTNLALVTDVGAVTATNVVFLTGAQIVSGLKTFDVRPQVGGTNLALTTDIVGGSVTNVLYLTGDQSINGIKNFTGTLQYNGNPVATYSSLNGSGFLKSTDAASTYLTTTNAASTYLTQTNASTTYASKSPTINTNTSTAIAVDSTFNNTMTTCNNASAITVTLAANLAVGFNCSFMQLGAGKITVAATSPATIYSYGNQYRSAGPYAVVSALCTSTNNYIVYGNTSI